MDRAFIFDVFGTLVDWREGVATIVGSAFEENGVTIDAYTFADAWRARYEPAMASIRMQGRAYVALDILHRENLDATLAEFGIENTFGQDEREALNQSWEKLLAWTDVHEGLDRLRLLGCVAPCSNASVALSLRLARFAKLNWDSIVGAEIAQNYKPAREVYISSCKTLGFEPKNVVMVAAHNDDLIAARSAGLQTAFIARPREYGEAQTVDLTPTSNWTYVAKDLVHLAEQIEIFG